MADTVIYPISENTGQDIVAQLALIASNVSYTLPEATTTALGGVRYDGETLMVNSAGQLYVAYVDVSDQVETMQSQIATLQSQVATLQRKVRELSGDTSTEASVSDDQLVLEGSLVSVSDDYLTIEDGTVVSDYLSFGDAASFVDGDYLSAQSASVSDDYLAITSGTVSDDVLNI